MFISESALRAVELFLGSRSKCHVGLEFENAAGKC